MMDVNWLAVVVAAVINMAVGFAWYSPMMFAKPWMKHIGMTMAELKKSQKSMGPSYGIITLGALVMSYVLARFVMAAGATTLFQGSEVGFWAWLGFQATFALAGVIFERRSWGLYWINVGYYLVVLILTGALLAVWH